MFSGLYSLIVGGISMFSRLYYSNAMPTALKEFTGSAVSVIMLAQNGWICANAISKSLWRQLISHKNLIEWVTAAESEKSQNFWGFFKRYIPSLVVGVLLLAFGRPIHILLGLAFLANIPFAWFSANARKKSVRIISEANKEKLKSYAKGMWKYYDELCTEENNYLPPDNFQETPVHRIAHRTSPTNIGFMLLCTLCAKDFGFIDINTMCNKLDKSITSVENLEKWKGNLLNWYNTKTLETLPPKYVSTVDSGNFLCSIVALRQGLCEIKSQHAMIPSLVDRLNELIDNADLSALYNKRRKLFHIGYNIEDESYSNCYYDLLMSEARMTSFYAIASRQVPKEHWGALGRTLATESRYAGPVSWTGTMFEYYMPSIVLPVYENTMGYEALRFCSWCQKRRVKGLKMPWGISESGFYSFDSQLNYQYKAHGVQKIGLKRGLNADIVISPYSTFLVLPFEPKAALKNLSELEEMQMTGRCGFYEAADFTVDRLDGQDYAVVRSYMAHHVGMSMLCITNLLMNNIVQKRFMSDEKMAGAISLLQEKIPAEATLFRDVDLHEVPQRPQREEPQTREFAGLNPLSPNVKLFTNGEWSMAICDNGSSISRYREADMTRYSNDLLKTPLGIFAFIKAGKRVLPITMALDYNSKAEFKASYSNTDMTLTAKAYNLEGSMTAMVHPRLPCEQRKITIRNLSKSECKGELVIYFEPTLSSHHEESQHPAFSKLFIQGEYDQKNKLLVFKRQSRKDDETLCLATGFAEDFDFDYGLSREAVLKSPNGISSLLTSKLTLYKDGTPDICTVFRIPISILPKQQVTKTLILCAASTREEAVERVLKARADGKLSPLTASPSPFKDDKIDGVIASTVLPHILFSQKQSKETQIFRIENSLYKRSIWAFGISGDNPIIFTQIDKQDEISRIAPYVRLAGKLRKSGIITDLVIGYKENGEYTAPLLSAIRQMLVKENAQETAGIFPIDLSKHDEQSITALMANAVYIAPQSERILLPAPKYVPFKVESTSPMNVKSENAFSVKHGYFTNGVFTVTDKPNLPWCVVLANNSFGTLVSDKSVGFSWAINSRENKLTPWTNDTMTDNTGEKIYLRINGVVYDLVAGATVRFSKKLVQYIGTVEGIDYNITVWVPQRGMIKHCDINFENRQMEDKNVEIVYYTEPVMGISRRESKLLKSKYDGRAITVSNHCTAGPYGHMRVGLLSAADFYTCDRAEFLNGKWEGDTQMPIEDCCAAVGKKIILPPKRQESVRFILSWGESEQASYIVTTRDLEIEKNENAIYISTPDKELNYMFNTWLPAQILNSRIRGRTGFFQCGGAYGFRDQLQDVSSLVLTNPKLVKTHIIRCCAHQFEQGDVLHWWHTMPKNVGGTKGVRTRYSDDLLWLPFVAAEYTQKTGDFSIFDIPVAYLAGQELAENEAEKYFELQKSNQKGTIYEHCTRAIERAMRFGDHGLSLIGGGDWNDGFNEVGKKGKGESVWLSQFFSMVLTKFAKICEQLNDEERAKRYVEEAKRLKQAIDEKAWNGEWYLRAFFDDGTPMGAKGSSECEIDSLTQSFSVLCDMPDEQRKNQALKSAVEKLVDTEHGIIKLFTPAFSANGKKAGYVNAYPEGIRENGGQYTHAAVWLCNALIKNGQIDTGYKLLRMINPAQKYRNKKEADKYKTEAFALAGDVYSKAGVEGRGGWSLYTGAAGWYYRTVYEELLGINQFHNKLLLNPKLPTAWNKYYAKLMIDGAVIDIEVKRGDQYSLKVDAKKAEFIPLDGKNHSVKLVIY
ncbi:MAG: glucoamylase family protein [Oscillospiraceae bacterium]